MADSSDAPAVLAPPRRLGRPRADPRPTEKEPREALLDAAAELFSTHGYGKATTRAIARAAGLRQPSMFHYFATKEELFAELLDRTVQPGMEILERLVEIDAPPDVRFYVLTYCDVKNLCSGAYNVPVLQMLAEARRPAFSAFWEKRERLLSGYLDLLAAGDAQGLMRIDEPRRVGLVICGAIESVPTWFERGVHDADEVSREVADLVVGGLVGFSRLERVRRAADRLIPVVSAPTRP
jgi:AcrR family transcriptional regulator